MAKRQGGGNSAGVVRMNNPANATEQAQAWEYAGEVGADWAFSTNGREFAGGRRGMMVRMEGRLTEFLGPGVLEPQIPFIAGIIDLGGQRGVPREGFSRAGGGFY